MNNSMINPSIVDLLKKVDNRYSLVMVSSRRARQIINGDAPRVECDSKKALTVAVNEVNDGVIQYESVKEGL